MKQSIEREKASNIDSADMKSIPQFLDARAHYTCSLFVFSKIKLLTCFYFLHIYFCFVWVEKPARRLSSRGGIHKNDFAGRQINNFSISPAPTDLQDTRNEISAERYFHVLVLNVMLSCGTMETENRKVLIKRLISVRSKKWAEKSELILFLSCFCSLFL